MAPRRHTCPSAWASGSAAGSRSSRSARIDASAAVKAAGARGVWWQPGRPENGADARGRHRTAGPLAAQAARAPAPRKHNCARMEDMQLLVRRPHERRRAVMTMPSSDGSDVQPERRARHPRCDGQSTPPRRAPCSSGAGGSRLCIGLVLVAAGFLRVYLFHARQLVGRPKVSQKASSRQYSVLVGARRLRAPLGLNALRSIASALCSPRATGGRPPSRRPVPSRASASERSRRARPPLFAQV